MRLCRCAREPQPCMMCGSDLRHLGSRKWMYCRSCTVARRRARSSRWYYQSLSEERIEANRRKASAWYQANRERKLKYLKRHKATKRQEREEWMQLRLPFAPLDEAREGRPIAVLFDPNGQRAWHRARTRGEFTLRQADRFCSALGLPLGYVYPEAM